MKCPNDGCTYELDKFADGEVWRCQSCDEAWTQTELEQRSQTQKELFRDLKTLDIEPWPSFVAIPVDRWLNEDHPVQRLNRLADACEVLTRYICAIGVADVYARNEGRLPENLRKRIAPKVRRPTFGAWIFMVEALLETSDMLADAGYPPSRAFLQVERAFTDDFQPLLKGETNDPTPEDAVLEMRNHVAHAGGIVREEASRLLREEGHEERVRSAFHHAEAWLSDFDVYYVADTGIPYQLQGRTPAPSQAEELSQVFQDRLDRYREQVVLRDPKTDLLNLNPFCGFGVPRVQVGQSVSNEVPEIYVRKEKKALRYNPLGAARSYSERRDIVLERFHSLFDVEVGRFGAGVDHFGEELRNDAQALIGRREELQRAVRTLKEGAREGEDQIFWLGGRAGTGKSMLMAAIAAHRKIGGGQQDPELKGADPSSLLVIPWRFKMGDARNNRKTFLQFAVHRLQTESPLPETVVSPKANLDVERANSADLSNRLQELLNAYSQLKPPSEHPQARAPQVLFLLDGLDEIYAKDERLSTMPFRYNRENVLWLCAGRPEAGLVQKFRNSDEAVELFPPSESNPAGGLPPMPAEEIREMFETRLVGELGYELRDLDEESDSGTHVRNPLIETVVERADGLPMYVDLVIEDLNRGDLDIDTAVEELPETIHDYYDNLVDRYELGSDSDLPTRLLALLAAAEEPLDEDALTTFISQAGNIDVANEERKAVENALDALGPMLRISPTPGDNTEAGYQLHHESFREHLEHSDEVGRFVDKATEVLGSTTLNWQELTHTSAFDYLTRHGISHLLDAHRTEDAVSLLRNLAFAETVCRRAGPRVLATFYEDSSAHVGGDSDLKKNLHLMACAIEMDLGFLRRHPDHLFQQVYNRCWWYDAKEAENYYCEPAGGWNDPPWNRTGPRLSKWMEDWRSQYSESNRPWIKSLRPLPNSVDSPLNTTMRGHSDTVRSVTFNPSSELIASGSSDGSVRIWDSGTGESVMHLRAHDGDVKSVDWSEDGHLVASGSVDQTIRLWDVSAWEETCCFRSHSGSITSVAIAPDNRHLVSASRDGTVRVWDFESGQELNSLDDINSPVLAVQWGPKSTRIGFVCEDGTVGIWDKSGNSGDRLIGKHEDTATTIAWNPRGDCLATASKNGTVRVWDPKSGNCLACLNGCIEGHDFPVWDVAWGPDGRSLASGGWDELVRVWESQNWNIQAELEGHSHWIRSVEISPAGGAIVSGAKDKTVRLWSLDPDKDVRELEGHEGWITAMQSSPDGTRIATGDWSRIWDETVRVWDTETGREVCRLEGHTDKIVGLKWSPDRRYLKSQSETGNELVWDIKSGERIKLENSASSVPELSDSEFDGEPSLECNSSKKETALRSSDQTTVGYLPHTFREVLTTGGRSEVVAGYSGKNIFLFSVVSA